MIYGKNIARGNASYIPLPGPYFIQLKFNTKMQDFERVWDKLQMKVELNN